ncbi:DUF3732 domain-containing protein [Streptomyces sp. NBC_01233]|uniref:DUF3732 domain-containing protein n=1 Tax=Streptomyces sp. NBC_01233 TaxID=2903787 RepID=UPI002E0FFDEF|nr:DUF3732 domain-containing protein [Streptomyces sp. NBC_01233]
MTFQISAISIYSADGRIRTVPFKTGRMNIITGDSRRGKSALLNIIDYCLASDDYGIQGAALRNFVRVFAVTLVKGDQQLFVARPAPPAKAATATTMCVVSQAHGAAPPPLIKLIFATPLDIAKALLSDFAGIDHTLRIPAVRSAKPIPPSVRHALFFCLQKQNEVANPDLLFHGQSEDFHRAAIRAMLPYFLGAVDPERALREHNLRLLRRQLADMENALAAARTMGPASGQARALLTEAIEAGLLAPLPGGHALLTAAQVLMGLRRAASGAVPDASPSGSEDPLTALTEDRRGLRQAHGRARARISNLKRIAQESDEFLGQAAEQHARLATLGLLPEPRTHEEEYTGQCPVCGSSTPQPGQIADIIRQDLARLNAEMTTIGSSTPDIAALIAEEENTLQELRASLARNQEEIDTLAAGQRFTAGQGDPLRRAAVVQGRISLFLETAARHEHVPQVVDRREDIVAQITELEEQLGTTVQDDRLSSSTSLVSAKIKDKAIRLDLEHRESPIRLDPRALTVVADTTRGPLRLPEIGGGENAMGYHVATMLSLHEWFREQGSPVPRFLILDQPSQVYYPEDANDGTPVTDRAALLNLYKTIQRTIDALQGEFQVIVMEHADLDEEPFRSAVQARWRRSNGDALVPHDWITDDINEDVTS